MLAVQVAWRQHMQSCLYFSKALPFNAVHVCCLYCSWHWQRLMSALRIWSLLYMLLQQRPVTSSTVTCMAVCSQLHCQAVASQPCLIYSIYLGYMEDFWSTQQIGQAAAEPAGSIKPSQTCSITYSLNDKILHGWTGHWRLLPQGHPGRQEGWKLDLGRHAAAQGSIDAELLPTAEGCAAQTDASIAEAMQMGDDDLLAGTPARRQAR